MDLEDFEQPEGIELLQKLPLFSRLDYGEASRLGAIVGHRDFPAGQVIIERGALGEALYVIVSGRVVVHRGGEGDAAGEALGHLGVGDIFGEMALVDDLLTSARVTAAEATRCLELPRGPFEALLGEDTTLALKIYKSFCRTLSDRLRTTNEVLTAAHAFDLGVR
jgi:CRP/FNR family transcriptional regulator, cyclic AMP receptor protein